MTENKAKKTGTIQTGSWIQGNDHTRNYSTEEVLKMVMTRVKNPDTETHVMVGTDSHVFGQNYHFVTVLCAYDVGKGGTYFYRSAIEPRKIFQGSQKMRLQDEVTKSLAIAYEVEGATGIKPVVHVDASPPSKKEFSSSFSDSLRGYVVASGYEAVLKPDSFVSNCIADKHTRRRTRGRKKWVVSNTPVKN